MKHYCSYCGAVYKLAEEISPVNRIEGPFEPNFRRKNLLDILRRLKHLHPNDRSFEEFMKMSEDELEQIVTPILQKEKIKIMKEPEKGNLIDLYK